MALDPEDKTWIASQFASLDRTMREGFESVKMDVAALTDLLNNRTEQLDDRIKGLRAVVNKRTRPFEGKNPPRHRGVGRG